MTTITQKTAGRPRSSEADQAILQTTLQLLVEQGYDAMSMEGVAAAAGVGKTTIYRRYPGKRELVVAAVSSLANTLETYADSGDVRADLYKFVGQFHRILKARNLYSMLGTVLVKEREDPELIELFRSLVIYPRMEAMSDILRRGIERGDVRSDIQVEVITQMIAGSIFARHIAGQAEDDQWLQSVIDAIWLGIAAH